MDLNALIRGTGQGATLGWSDELIAALLADKARLDRGALPSQVGPWDVQQSPWSIMSSEYQQLRDQERAANEAAMSRAPGEYISGNLLGGAAYAPVTGIWPNMAQAAATGAGVAGSPTEMAPEAAKEMAITGGMTAASPWLGMAAGKIIKFPGGSGRGLTPFEEKYGKQIVDESAGFLTPEQQAANRAKATAEANQRAMRDLKSKPQESSGSTSISEINAMADSIRSGKSLDEYYVKTMMSDHLPKEVFGEPIRGKNGSISYIPEESKSIISGDGTYPRITFVPNGKASEYSSNAGMHKHYDSVDDFVSNMDLDISDAQKDLFHTIYVYIGKPK